MIVEMWLLFGFNHPNPRGLGLWESGQTTPTSMFQSSQPAGVGSYPAFSNSLSALRFNHPSPRGLGQQKNIIKYISFMIMFVLFYQLHIYIYRIANHNICFFHSICTKNGANLEAFYVHFTFAPSLYYIFFFLPSKGFLTIFYS